MADPPTIDLAGDVGEDPDHGRELAFMASLSSVSIACGGHAGDDRTMRATLAGALELGCAPGAHPSVPDRAHFGRRIPADAHEPARIASLGASVADQLRALAGVASECGVALSHVKAHGALYHLTAHYAPHADTLAASVALALGRTPALVAPAGSPAASRWRTGRLRVIEEAFADRRYRADGALVPRDAGGVLTDPDRVTEQALRLVLEGEVVAEDGRALRIAPERLCLHADTQGAVELAARVREALLAAGVTINAPDP